MTALKTLVIALVAAVVAAYPVQKLVADAWNAPIVVVWAAWLALAVGIWLSIRAVIVRRQRRSE